VTSAAAPPTADAAPTEPPARDREGAPAVEPSRALVLGLWWAIFLTIGVAGVAILLQGANRPADPTLAPRAPLEGFGEVAVDVVAPDGTGHRWCLLVAETPEQRQQGLMGVTDETLGGHDGMLFRFEDETTVGFWMKDTPMPLTVAYIDSDGGLVSSADMEPCLGAAAAASDCPSYPPAGPYRWAVEVPQGNLGSLGIVPGARFTDTGDPCPP
jgi:uncharacterized membrane protein (UPF0127 family)